MTEMMDFSVPREAAPKPIEFKVDDDVFQAYPAVGGGVMLDTLTFDVNVLDLENLDNPNVEASPKQIAAMTSAINNQARKLLGFLDIALLPASAERFAERMRSTTEPITLDQALEISRWLMGQYGVRPTEPSSPSSNGHDGTGTTSMVGVQAEASTP